jgi:hypothetical protein
VFEAARLLRDSKDIHFLLGLGDQVRKVEGNASRGQASKRHPGRSRRGRTVRGRLAADIWIIPYRKNVAGVSVLSGFDNLLAIDRPVIVVPEAAVTVTD